MALVRMGSLAFNYFMDLLEFKKFFLGRWKSRTWRDAIGSSWTRTRGIPFRYIEEPLFYSQLDIRKKLASVRPLIMLEVSSSLAKAQNGHFKSRSTVLTRMKVP